MPRSKEMWLTDFGLSNFRIQNYGTAASVDILLADFTFVPLWLAFDFESHHSLEKSRFGGPRPRGQFFELQPALKSGTFSTGSNTSARGLPAALATC